MFQICDRYDSKKVYTVFSVRDYPNSIVQKPEFLIYKNNKWKWVRADEYKPR